MSQDTALPTITSREWAWLRTAWLAHFGRKLPEDTEAAQTILKSLKHACHCASNLQPWFEAWVLSDPIPRPASFIAYCGRRQQERPWSEQPPPVQQTGPGWASQAEPLRNLLRQWKANEGAIPHVEPNSTARAIGELLPFAFPPVRNAYRRALAERGKGEAEGGEGRDVPESEMPF